MMILAAADREPARMGPQGLYMRQGMAFGTWVRVGRRISEISNASSWWLGDWLVYGQDAYGERYRAAVEATGLDYKTLRNYAWVARRFPPPRRRVALSLQHHAEVASLPDVEQDLWLRRAERFGWSRNQLRRRVSEHRLVRSGADHDPAVMCRIAVTAAQRRRWREAAHLCDRALTEWMIAAIDSAAEEILTTCSRQGSGLGDSSPTIPIKVEARPCQPEAVER
jgi:hypothetical protein